MRNSDDCSANCNAIKSLLHSSLTLGIQSGGCLQQDYVGHAAVCLWKATAQMCQSCSYPMQVTASRAKNMQPALEMRSHSSPVSHQAIIPTCTSHRCFMTGTCSKHSRTTGNPDVMQLPWCLAPLQLKQAVLEGPLKEQGGRLGQQHTSSSSSTRGRVRIALAMAIRCFCPPDSLMPRSPTVVW